MIFKKINGCFAWLLALIMLAHLGTMSYSMMTGWYNLAVCKGLAHWSAGVCTIHVILSIIIVMFIHDGTELSYYKKLNAKVIIQRVTAIVICALLHVHIRAFSFIMEGTVLTGGAKLWIIVTEFVFFGALLLHTGVSFTRAVINMGLIRTDEAERRLNTITYGICIAAMALACFALMVFVIGWKGALH